MSASKRRRGRHVGANSKVEGGVDEEGRTWRTRGEDEDEEEERTRRWGEDEDEEVVRRRTRTRR